MYRWDFVAAYLQGDLEDGEVIYCSEPPGYETLGADGRARVCRVDKPIYGMAQSGRRWQRGLFAWITSWSPRPESPSAPTLRPSENDESVFYLRDTVDTRDGPREETLLL